MDNSFTPVFTLKLKYKIIEGLVTVGKYDGKHPCLTCATSASKVVFYNWKMFQLTEKKVFIQNIFLCILFLSLIFKKLKKSFFLIKFCSNM